MTLLRRSPTPVPSAMTSAQWALTGALALLLLAGLAALGPLLRGSGWWFASAFVGLVVIASAAWFRTLRVAPSFVPVAALGVLLALLTLLFGGGSGLFWLIPMPETLGRFGELVSAGAISIQQQSAPAEPIDGIVFILASGTGLIAVAMDVLALTLRWPALAGLPMLIPVAVPGLIIDGGADAGALMLTGAAYLVLLRVDVRVRRLAEATFPDPGRDAPRVIAPVTRGGPGPLWGSLVVGGIGIVSALVLSTATPAFTAGSLINSGANGQLFAAGVSPMVDLGQDLRRPQPGPALHYRTNATKLPYFKLLTLDQFVGRTWTARATRSGTAEGETNDGVNSLASPPGLSSRVGTTETTTDIVIDGVETTWLPVPVPATEVAGLEGNWHSDASARSISSNDSTTRGQTYTVTALEVEPTAEQLRNSSTNYPFSVMRSLEVPVPTPEIIQQTAQEVTAGATSPYDQAVELQQYLRSSAFVYDTKAPVKEGYDGGGADVIATFLDVKRGYCVHFASSMAIMARTIGIPARIALGYLPGEKATNITEDADRYNVDSHDLHSWPELYFVGVGWIPFEPTPGRGSVPAYSTPAAALGSGPTAGATVPSTAQRSAEDLLADEPGAATSSTATAQESDMPLRVGVALAIVVVLLLTPGAARLLRRRSRMRRIASGRGAAPDAWVELSDTALDHGVEVTDRETPRSLAGHLRVLAVPDGSDDADGSRVADALERLLVAEERASYGRAGGASQAVGGALLEADLAMVIRALHTRAPRRVRWRALLLPASLWPTGLSWRNGEATANA
ncbi:MAG: hypothetical protein JWQ59_2090 [Cryobacterium sp.]|nr:hypothetical protein [Cryobacterium sp.]